MKKIIDILASAILLISTLPIRASAENNGLYEAKNAILFSTMTVIDNINASRSLFVGNLSDSSNKFNSFITVSTDSIYDLAFCSMGIGVDKTNNTMSQLKIYYQNVTSNHFTKLYFSSHW